MIPQIVRRSVLYPCFAVLAALALTNARAAYDPNAATAPSTAPSMARPSMQTAQDRIVQQAAAALFLEDAATLERLAAQADQLAREGKIRFRSLGVTLHEMAATLAASRQKTLRQAETLDHDARAAGHVSLLERLKQQDPLLQARQIERKKQWNRAVAPINYVSRSLASLFQGNLQVLLAWTVDAADAVRNGESRNEWDRKLRTLYVEHLAQNPGTSPENAEVQARMRELSEKDRRQAGRELLRLSELHLQAGHPQEALFYAREARALGADAQTAELKAAQTISQNYRDRLKSLEVADAGQSENAELKKQLEALISRAVRTPATSDATDADLQTARSQFARERTRYIFVDDLPARDQLHAAASGQGLRRRGPLSQVISAVFFPDGIVRGIKVMFGSGPSNDELRDAAARRIQAAPNTPEAAELRSWLAKQAVKRGEYEQASAIYARTGQNDQQEKLRQKQAKDLFLQIRRVPDPIQRQKLLKRSAETFRGTAYESKARDEAAALQQDLQITLTRQQLAAMPALMRSLGWNPVWFDGRFENKELADNAATFIPPDYHEIIVNFEGADGQIEQRHQQVQGPALPKLHATLDEYQLRQKRIEAAEALSAKRYLPIDIQGGVGAEGLSVYPTLQPYRMSQEEAPLYR